MSLLTQSAIAGCCAVTAEVTVASMAEPTIYDFGFEDQTKGRLVNNVGQPADGTVVSTQAVRGTYSLRLNIPTTPGGDGGGGAVKYNFNTHPPRPKDFWTRFAFRYDDLPTSICKIKRFQNQGGSPGCGSVTFNGSTNQKLNWFWDNFQSGGGPDFGGVLVADRWYWLEIHHQTFGSTDKFHVQIYLDDVLELDEDSDLDNDGNNGMAILIYDGTVNQGNTVSTKMWIDGIGLSAEKMGIPA